MTLLEVMSSAESFCEVKHIDEYQNVQFTMPNKTVVSIGYGHRHYGSQRDPSLAMGDRNYATLTDAHAVEVYCWKENGKIYRSRKFAFQRDGIKGWVTPDELFSILKHVARRRI